MRRILTVLIILALFTGCSWIKKISPGWAAGPTPEQQIEQLTQGLLDFKFKLGAEMQISARLKAQNIQLQKQLNETGRLLEEKLNALVEANAKVAKLEMKPEEGENEAPDKSNTD